MIDVNYVLVFCILGIEVKFVNVVLVGCNYVVLCGCEKIKVSVSDLDVFDEVGELI